MRRLFVCLCLTVPMLGSQPTAASAEDQEIAQQIANVMQISGAMKDYDVAVKYNNGTAWLRGTVTNQQQMNTALEIAKASPHVTQVVNQLRTGAAPANGGQALTGLPSAPMPPAPPMAAQRQVPVRQVSAQQMAASRPGASVLTRPVARPAPFAPSSMMHGAARMAQAMPGGAGMVGGPGGGPGPAPAFVPGTGGGVAPASYDQPNMPGYAWPSYAAYPNYGALTYPRQYSPTAWPYIGPFYPYPQVPLGWRKVQLEWDDGWWFLDFKD